MAESAAHGAGDGAESAPGGRQLRVHGRQVRAAVQPGEVGRGGGIALPVGRGLCVGHGVAAGALKARPGHRQRVRQRRDGRRAPDGHGGAGGARGDGGPGGRWGGRRAVVGAGVGLAHAGLAGGRGLLLRGSGFGLAAGLLLLLLTTLGAPVLKPHLKGKNTVALRYRTPGTPLTHETPGLSCFKFELFLFVVYCLFIFLIYICIRNTHKQQTGKIY